MSASPSASIDVTGDDVLGEVLMIRPLSDTIGTSFGAIAGPDPFEFIGVETGLPKVVFDGLTDMSKVSRWSDESSCELSVVVDLATDMMLSKKHRSCNCKNIERKRLL